MSRLAGAALHVEEVFAAAGLNIRGEPIAAWRIRITCPNCARTSGADEVRYQEAGEQTNHDCRYSAATMLTVGRARRPGGYHLKGWTVTPLAGMVIEIDEPV